MSDTNPHIAKFLSSRQMEGSEMQGQVINLGKALVKELDLEPGVDTLSRWMAHYIAEQIITAENAAGDEKSKAEQKCFETILELWQRRSALPDGRRPFENFEPILRALERLDPENSQPFYYTQPRVHLSGKNDTSKPISKNVQKWIDNALGLDRAARVLIEFAFKQATTSAKDKKTRAWIENAIDLKDSDEISIVIRLISAYKDGQDEKAREDLQEEQRNHFKSRIEKLDTFLELSSSLRAALTGELDKLSTDSPRSDNDNIPKRTSKKSK